jgi:hypothetical protein
MTRCISSCESVISLSVAVICLTSSSDQSRSHNLTQYTTNVSSQRPSIPTAHVFAPSNEVTLVLRASLVGVLIDSHRGQALNRCESLRQEVQKPPLGRSSWQGARQTSTTASANTLTNDTGSCIPFSTPQRITSARSMKSSSAMASIYITRATCD